MNEHESTKSSLNKKTVSEKDDGAASAAGDSTSSNDTASEGANSTSDSNSTKSSKKEEVDAGSPADVYPYYRATHEKAASKNDEEEKKPFEPRPLKYKENYEDKGIKVFKLDLDSLSKPALKKKSSTESSEESATSSSAGKNGTAAAGSPGKSTSANSPASVEAF